MLTVLTVCHELACSLMIRLPAWPSRLTAISMPSARREVCARRKRPATARGFWGQPVRSLPIPSLLCSALARSSSAVLPAQELRSAISSRSGDASDVNGLRQHRQH
jgi:hypothetical protein